MTRDWDSVHHIHSNQHNFLYLQCYILGIFPVIFFGWFIQSSSLGSLLGFLFLCFLGVSFLGFLCWVIFGTKSRIFLGGESILVQTKTRFPTSRWNWWISIPNIWASPKLITVLSCECLRKNSTEYAATYPPLGTQVRSFFNIYYYNS